jgi:hypothetical protein
MTVERNGEVVALYLEEEIVCPLCATESEKSLSAREESMELEELEGAIDGLWCDRCGTTIACASPSALILASPAC